MPRVIYTKKRSLDSGSVDDSETIEFNAIEANPFDQINNEETMTMGKAVKSVLENILEGWQITVKVDYSELGQWREFIHSVSSREQFEFDPTGTVASPGSTETVTLNVNQVRYQRIKPDYMNFRLTFEKTS